MSDQDVKTTESNFRYRRIQNVIGWTVEVLDGDEVVASGNFTRVPGPRPVYWSHGLTVQEKYRRMGLSTAVHEILFEAIPDNAVVLLTVAHGNFAQKQRMQKLGYNLVVEADGYNVYATHKPTNEAMKEVT